METLEINHVNCLTTYGPQMGAPSLSPRPVGGRARTRAQDGPRVHVRVDLTSTPGSRIPSVPTPCWCPSGMGLVTTANLKFIL